MRDNLGQRPRNIEDGIIWARHTFQDLFHNNIAQRLFKLASNRVHTLRDLGCYLGHPIDDKSQCLGSLSGQDSSDAHTCLCSMWTMFGGCFFHSLDCRRFLHSLAAAHGVRHCCCESASTSIWTESSDVLSAMTPYWVCGKHGWIEGDRNPALFCCCAQVSSRSLVCSELWYGTLYSLL